MQSPSHVASRKRTLANVANARDSLQHIIAERTLTSRPLLIRKFRAIATVSAAFAALAFVRSAEAQNLLVNGGFEAGVFSPWTRSGNTVQVAVTCGGGAQEGNCDATLGAPGGIIGRLEQSVATTIGTTYTFSFWNSQAPGNTSSFAAYIGGLTAYSESTAQSYAYTKRTFTYVAIGATTNIAFEYQNFNNFAHLDNVSLVTTTPEPSTYALMAAGLLALGAVARRRK